MPLAGGCSFPESPGRSVEDARLFWRADWDPSVIAVEAISAPLGDPDAFDISRVDDFGTVLRHADGHESVAFSDGMRHLQLEVVEGAVTDGPVRLHYRLSGLRLVEVQILTIRRFVQLCRLGRFPKGLFPREPRAHRWIMALRAYDGMACGASYRDIAAVLFGEQRARDDWSSRSDYLRLRVQRLIRGAFAMIHGGYCDLLRGPLPRGAGTTGRMGAEPYQRRRGVVRQ